MCTGFTPSPKMDFESAMQTFAEAWMAANRTGKGVFGNDTIEKPTKAYDEEGEKSEEIVSPHGRFLLTNLNYKGRNLSVCLSVTLLLLF